MLRSLFDHLQAEHTILVSGTYYSNNGSIVLYSIFHYRVLYVVRGARGSVVVKALCYKPEGREFETR
jgi:hypothetical protein